VTRSIRVALITIIVAITLSCQSLHFTPSNVEAGTSNPNSPNTQTTRTAASCNSSDVQATINTSADGDTVIIPAGTCTWTSTVVLTSRINVTGQDPSNSNMSCIQGNEAGCGSLGGGATVIIDNVSKSENNPLMSWNFPLTDNGPLTIGNFTIGGQATDPLEVSSHLSITGGSHQLRIHDLTIGITNYPEETYGIKLFGDLQGVIDHSTFFAPSGDAQIAANVAHDQYQGVGNYGDNSWAQPDTIGTAAAIFLENNWLNMADQAGHGLIDVFQGGRVVARYNKVAFMASHGTESGQRKRSARQFEIYNNDYTAVNQGMPCGGCNTFYFARGGTGIVFGNTGNGTVWNSSVYGANYRDVDEFAPWGNRGPGGTGVTIKGACDGTGMYDRDGPVIFSGTATGGTSGSSTAAAVLQDTTQNWQTSWLNYSLRDVTQGWGSAITWNTSMSITVTVSAYGNSRKVAAGDTYQIYNPYPCLDQPGRGAGALLADQPPSPATSLKQAQRPIYAWNNTKNGGNLPAANQYAHIQPNRDYFDMNTAWTPGNNCTTGVCVGTHAQRLAISGACNLTGCSAPGTGFWETDTNSLYVWQNSAWALYYQPYVYPHPLDAEPDNLLTPTALSHTVQ
jgi:hypothetical protein